MPDLPDDILIQAGMMGMARCYLKRWTIHIQPVDLGAARELYEKLLNMPHLSDQIKPWALFGKAECLLLSGQQSEFEVAYQCYETLLNMPGLLGEIKQSAIFGKAQCLLIGWPPQQPSAPDAAYQLLEIVLNMSESLREKKIPRRETVRKATPTTTQSDVPEQANISQPQASSSNQSTD
jgi:hypothetical protein